MMPILFEPEAWEDYLYWHETDKQIARRINALIKDASRTPFTGIGKPEMLKNDYAGFWSRRIDQEHRLVYAVKDKRLHIIQCRFHYKK